MLTITKKIEFDYGHRVVGHEGKCRFLHGHRGVLDITVTADSLDSIDRIIDFGVMKSIFKEWVDKHWDHNLILNPKDPLLDLSDEDLSYVTNKRSAYIMPEEHPNPTAENIAIVFFKEMEKVLANHCRVFPVPVRLVCITFYETPNSWATYKGK